MEQIQGDRNIYSKNVSYQVNIYQTVQGKQEQEHSCVELSSIVRNEVRSGLAGPGLDSHLLTCGENVSYEVCTHWTTEGQQGSEPQYNNEADDYDYI